MAFKDPHSSYIFVHLSPLICPTKCCFEPRLHPRDPGHLMSVSLQAILSMGGFVYAGVAHPYLDGSGKTLTISFTNDNHIQVIKVTFL
ncbi:hypothetical protein F4809DRAFT_647078 [Biscogniauxia mediterranea]|nr:hypothetical protein F4809DRAFT_647078 [Biscogniauxia mediterranea]